MRPLTAFFFLATAFSVTFEKVHWELAGTVSLADVLTLLFLISFAVEWALRSSVRVPLSAAVVAAFLAAFLLVYLIGFFNLDTGQALAQFGKGLVKFVIHFAFLAVAIAYLARRSERFYWLALGWFCAGLAANSAYGVAQLAAAETGRDLDAIVLAPLTGGASAINIYGAVEGQSVFRPNALTGDPNHLGIMLVMPLLVLTPLYLRLERGHPLRMPLALLLGFLLVVELATLSRSGLLGLGLNNFSVYYEFVTGKTNWGPHSFYVALIVETGVVGTLLFAAFLRYLFTRLREARRLGRKLAELRDPVAARLRPLAWGLTAALAGTMAANAFYLTMQFYYFYFFAALGAAAPLVFSRRLGARA